MDHTQENVIFTHVRPSHLEQEYIWQVHIKAPALN